jgi:hypothetical protein
MADIFETIWASDDDALISVPSEAEIEHGFGCGPASPGRFNWLFQTIMSAINSLNIGDMASKFRSISTTEGLTGGGNLEVDRTLRLHYPGLEVVEEVANDDLVAIYDTSAAKHVSISREDFVAGLGGEGGGITAGANIGTGEGSIYSGVSGTSLQFRKVKAGKRHRGRDCD